MFESCANSTFTILSVESTSQLLFESEYSPLFAMREGTLSFESEAIDLIIKNLQNSQTERACPKVSEFLTTPALFNYYMSPNHLNVYVRIRPLTVRESVETQNTGKVFLKDTSRTTSVLQDNIIIFGNTSLLRNRSYN
jgi:hypothetical protein